MVLSGNTKTWLVVTAVFLAVAVYFFVIGEWKRGLLFLFVTGFNLSWVMFMYEIKPRKKVD